MMGAVASPLPAAVCKYCAWPDLPEAHTLPLVGQLRCSTVFLFTDQTHRGRCVVAFDRHCTELFHLTPAEQALWIRDLADVAAAIQAVTGCDKVNYASFGDVFNHLHFHLVPKKAGQTNWGRPFELESSTPVLLDALVQDDLVMQLRVNLAHRVEISW